MTCSVDEIAGVYSHSCVDLAVAPVGHPGGAQPGTKRGPITCAVTWNEACHPSLSAEHGGSSMKDVSWLGRPDRGRCDEERRADRYEPPEVADGPTGETTGEAAGGEGRDQRPCPVPGHAVACGR